MNFLFEFLRRPAPRPGSDMPAYYRKALTVDQSMLAVYFPLCCALLLWQTGRFYWMPLAMGAVMAISLRLVNQLNIRVSMALCALTALVWCGWFVSTFGWSGGVQLLLLPLLVLVYFNIYEAPAVKLLYSLILLAFRVGLFYYSLRHAASHPLNEADIVLFQCLNSALVFVSMSFNCILFSSNTQATERQLRLDNQQLHHKAETDPLTQLPNRRAMRNFIDLFMAESPELGFSVAIADIDFFKKVNDTYGHNCGDYTLQQLSALFREHAGDDYSVCRWGGEEFCFFLPGKNLDQAGQKMIDVCAAARKLPLSFGGVDFSITVTIGVEEYDFTSPVDDILEQADRKLYIGKSSGRNQVVI